MRDPFQIPNFFFVILKIKNFWSRIFQNLKHVQIPTSVSQNRVEWWYLRCYSLILFEVILRKSHLLSPKRLNNNLQYVFMPNGENTSSCEVFDIQLNLSKDLNCFMWTQDKPLPGVFTEYTPHRNFISKQKVYIQWVRAIWFTIKLQIHKLTTKHKTEMIQILNYRHYHIKWILNLKQHISR